jgi:uncharacterized OB-fold protein
MTDHPPTRLLPQPTADSAAFWTGGEREELLIYRCRDCGQRFHPPLPACHHCRGRDVGPEPVSGRASVAAFSVNHHPWLPGFDPPYVVAIVEIEEDPSVRLTTQIIGCPPDDVHVGQAVEVEFEHREDVWIPLFRPVAT